MDERVRRARLLYERAVFGGDGAPLPEAGRELDAVEADLAVARGRLMHARFLLRRDDTRRTVRSARRRVYLTPHWNGTRWSSCH